MLNTPTPPSFLRAAVLLVAAAWSAAAFADTPVADREFLDAQLPAVQGFGEKAASVQSPEDGLEMVRRLLAHRRETLAALDARESLTSLNGIETQDAYDLAVLESVRALSAAGLAADTTALTPAEAQVFLNHLGAVPDLGKSPVAFMILGMAELVQASVDTALERSLSRRKASRIALGLIRGAADSYYASRGDEVLTAGSQNFRQTSIVMRLRCPKDGSAYRVNDKKNRVQADGSIVTLYYLQCEAAADPQLLEFPYELASKLNRMSEKQHLEAQPRPKRPNSIDP